eukprot:TRINITY_DN2534_c0_g1_i1.p1 TRINITY_DN2534_c0_g1~~TRINITY_DN2534_c0_g1_i1.p1  ORF type:complete len:259 (+),score=48.10 TRINITY_DN2534_c0_g1_i1:112-888(+)
MSSNRVTWTSSGTIKLSKGKNFSIGTRAKSDKIVFDGNEFSIGQMSKVSSANDIFDSRSSGNMGSRSSRNKKIITYSKNFRLKIKGGTIPKLIELFVTEKDDDDSADWINTWLLTYRNFISPLDFLDELFSNFSGEDDEWISKGNRIGDILKKWMSHFFIDFVSDLSLGVTLRDHTFNTFCKYPEMEALGEEIISLYTQKEDEYQEQANTSVNIQNDAPVPIFPGGNQFCDFDPLEFARQICLYEHEIYRYPSNQCNF